MKPSSQYYDGGLPPVRRPHLTLDGREPAITRKPKRASSGVGSRASQCYCPTCGLKPRACRCEATA